MSASDTDPVRVMLVGDCPLVRSGFRQVLESAGLADLQRWSRRVLKSSTVEEIFQ